MTHVKNKYSDGLFFPNGYFSTGSQGRMGFVSSIMKRWLTEYLAVPNAVRPSDPSALGNHIVANVAKAANRYLLVAPVALPTAVLSTFLTSLALPDDILADVQPTFGNSPALRIPFSSLASTWTQPGCYNMTTGAPPGGATTASYALVATFLPSGNLLDDAPALVLSKYVQPMGSTYSGWPNTPGGPQGWPVLLYLLHTPLSATHTVTARAGSGFSVSLPGLTSVAMQLGGTGLTSVTL